MANKDSLIKNILYKEMFLVGNYDTYKLMNVVRFMEKDDLIEMRDEIARDRTWGLF